MATGALKSQMHSWESRTQHGRVVCGPGDTGKALFCHPWLTRGLFQEELKVKAGIKLPA